ncbi:MAG: nitrophenyl compound nitroreductase subunit ArsF family protein [Patescibacteria group bacterium]|nr:nitrophenyl compound nitroreductase subunit ArsF family protein [Patescibacteria group bacterium]
MNKKVLTFILLILSIFIFTGCSSSNNKSKSSGTNEVKASETKLKADKVQVFTFHATKRCATCIAIGKLSGETVEEYYQPELRDGKIEVREINIDLPENKELAEKFQASGSSLKINAIYDGQDYITEDTAVWRLTSNPDQYKSYLKNKIDNLLGK